MRAPPLVVAGLCTLAGCALEWHEPVGGSASGAGDVGGSASGAGGGGSSQPFGGTAHRIPGTIQAEDFDNGGPEVAYRDSTAGNMGKVYRTGVDVDIHGPLDGSPVIGTTWAGEWLNYSVSVAEDGLYKLELRVSSLDTGGQLRLEVAGSKIIDLQMPQGADPIVWTTIDGQVSLSRGEQILRLVFVKLGSEGTEVANVNWIRLTAL